MNKPRWLFLGDSLIEFCNWQEHFRGVEITNLGMAGETVEGLHGRLSNIMNRFSVCDLILVMSGTNNVGMEDFAFFNTYERLLDELAAHYPRAKIIVNGLMPFRMPWLAEDAVVRINKHLQEMTKRKEVDFLDVYEPFSVAENRHGKQCFLEDGVHLSDDGYKVWIDSITARFFGE